VREKTLFHWAPEFLVAIKKRFCKLTPRLLQFDKIGNNLKPTFDCTDTALGWTIFTNVRTDTGVLL
jgi:hypothetical protein